MGLCHSQMSGMAGGGMMIMVADSEFPGMLASTIAGGTSSR